jgi:DNA-binding response OmpR family regulator
MGARILIVDDDEVLQRGIKRAAEKAGYEVTQTFNGFDALRLAAQEKFDLILLDISMPVLDGRDVLARLKADPATADIPVVIHSSRTGQPDRHLALELGAVDYVEKSTELWSLMARIRRVLEQNQKP